MIKETSTRKDKTSQSWAEEEAWIDVTVCAHFFLLESFPVSFKIRVVGRRDSPAMHKHTLPHYHNLWPGLQRTVGSWRLPCLSCKARAETDMLVAHQQLEHLLGELQVRRVFSKFPLRHHLVSPLPSASRLCAKLQTLMMAQKSIWKSRLCAISAAADEKHPVRQWRIQAQQKLWSELSPLFSHLLLALFLLLCCSLLHRWVPSTLAQVKSLSVQDKSDEHK